MPVPNMEKANLTGKACASSISKHFGISYDARKLKGLTYPLGFFRKIDSLFYRTKN